MNIPIYQPTESPIPAPGVRSDANVPAGAFGGGIAAATANIGEIGRQVAETTMAKINYAAVTDARLAFENAVDQQTSPLYGLRGSAARGAPEKAAEAIAKTRDQFRSGLSAQQKAEFDRQTLTYAHSVQSAVVRHTQQQLDQWTLDAASSSRASTISAAGMWFGSPGRMDALHDQLLDSVDRVNSLTGAVGQKDDGSPDTSVADANRLQATTKFWGAAVQGYLGQDSPDKALQIVKDHGDEIDQTLHKQWMTQLESQSQIVKVQRIANEIIASQDYVDGHGTVDFDGAVKAARARKDLEGTTLNGVLKQIEQMRTENRKKQQDDQADSWTRLHQFRVEHPDISLASMTPAQLQSLNPSPAVTEYVVRAQNSAMTHPPKDPEALADTELKLLERILLYNKKADPDKSEFNAINSAVATLEIENAKAGGRPRREWDYKVNPDKTMPRPIWEFMYHDIVTGGAKGGGGLVGRIKQDVQNAAKGKFWQWSLWSGSEPKSIEVQARAQTIIDQVRDAIHSHPTWRAEDILKYYEGSSLAKAVIDQSTRGRWQKTLTDLPADDMPAGAVESFDPNELR